MSRLRLPLPSSAAPALDVVARQLDRPDHDGAARELHRTCRQYREAARATLRQLPLHRCFYRWAAQQDDHAAATGPHAVPLVPLGFILGCMRATGWTLHPEQLASFDEDILEQLAAATARVRRLEVVGWKGSLSSSVQVQGFGRLLRACHQLAEVHVCSVEPHDDSSVHLIWDPDSTTPTTSSSSSSSSSSTSTSSSSSSSGPFGPPLSLQCWEASGVPADLVLRWIQQQPQPQQLRHTLTRLSLRDSGDRVDVSPLTAVKGLRELEVTSPTRESLMQLSSCSSLTRLRVGEVYKRSRVWGPAAEAVAGLTSMRHLVLEGEEPLLPPSFSALKQLTCLVACGGHLSRIPADLGVWCPRLVRLAADIRPSPLIGSCKVGLLVVPASVTRLTHLELSASRGTHVELQGNLPHLQELVLGPSSCTAITGLSNAPNLQLLDVTNTSALRSSLDALQPLTALRNLNFDRHPCVDPASFSVIGALQRLTSLSASGCTAVAWGALGATPPLRSLLELSLDTGDDYGALAALGPWLVQLTALTSFRLAVKQRKLRFRDWELGLDKRDKAHGQEVLVFPRGLRHLDLSCVDWHAHRLPRGLLRLTALEVLHIRVPWRGLPTWFTKLRRLQALALWPSQDPRPAYLSHQDFGYATKPVVRQMPGLRAVHMSGRSIPIDGSTWAWVQWYVFDRRVMCSAVSPSGSPSMQLARPRCAVHPGM